MHCSVQNLLRLIIEYGSSIWGPRYNGLNDELENVQKRAARFVTINYSLALKLRVRLASLKNQNGKPSKNGRRIIGSYNCKMV